MLLNTKKSREGNRGNEDNPINVLLLLIPLAMSMLFTVSVQHAEEDRVSKRGGAERRRIQFVPINWRVFYATSSTLKFACK